MATGRLRQCGFTLVELMISLTIGAFILYGLVNILISNKQSSQMERSLARLQENGRAALDLMISDINDAMYIGCKSSISGLSVMAKSIEWVGMQGYEHGTTSWDPSLPTKLSDLENVARVGSDMLNLQHATPLNMFPSGLVLPGDTAVPLAENTACVSQGDLVVIASCVTSHLFQVTNEPACGGGIGTSLAFAASGNDVISMEPGYNTNHPLLQFFDKTWFVADTQRRRTDSGIPVYALYRRVNGVTEEMIEGVEYLQVTYGQELSSGNIRYVAADDPNLRLEDLVSIRIALLVQSFETVLNAPDEAEYQLLDESIGVTGDIKHNNDSTLRRVFRTTVLLRNKALGA